MAFAAVAVRGILGVVAIFSVGLGFISATILAGLAAAAPSHFNRHLIQRSSIQTTGHAPRVKRDHGNPCLVAPTAQDVRSTGDAVADGQNGSFVCPAGFSRG
jgi:hypothetical protein